MAGEQDRRPALVEVEHEPPNRLDALRIQTVGRLVQNEQSWLAHQRGGQSEPLTHAE